jgi:outer membrane lipoprotein-sorting protein
MNSPVHKPVSFIPRLDGTSRRGLTARAALLLALTGLLLAGTTAFSGSPDAALDAVLASLAKHRHGHVLYSEQIESALFKHPLYTSGELFFDAPDRLEKRTSQPAPEDLLVEGDVVTIVRGTHRTSMRLSDHPQLSPLLNGIRATLAGDRSALEKYFQLAFTADESQWELVLQPLSSESKPVYKRVVIRGIDGTVRSVTLERATGERTTMALSEPADS